jgi:hypothetical protein
VQLSRATFAFMSYGYDYPTRRGYRLTEDAELDYQAWRDMGGCSCPTGNPPCSYCTHQGHPLSLENDDDAWIPEQLRELPLSVHLKLDDMWNRGLSNAWISEHTRIPLADLEWFESRRLVNRVYFSPNIPNFRDYNNLQALLIDHTSIPYPI